MGLTINTNLSAMYSSIFAGRNSRSLMSSLEKLASGLAINRASDDPAGLVISEQLRSRVATLNQEIENTSALINKYQTASSTVMEMRSHLTEMRTLAVAASNEGVNDENAQAAYQTTANHLVSTYNRTLDLATYNGSHLLDGSENAVAEVSELEDLDLSSAEAAAASVERIDEAISELDSVQGELGAVQANELEARRNSLEITAQNVQAAESMLRDTDYAKEYSNSVAGIIRLRASVSMLAHSYLQADSILSMLEAEQ